MAWHTAGVTPAQLRDVVEAVSGRGVLQLAGLSGGDVSTSVRADLDDGTSVFAKTHTDPPPHFYTTEAAGLDWLAEPACIRVPAVIAVSDDPAYLILEWIDEAPRPPLDDAALGRNLAALHGAGAPSYGREDNRTTGSLALPNAPCNDWPTFYAQRRLLPLARIATDRGSLPGQLTEAIEQLASRLEGLAPAEPPARLHGDLWAGNRIVDSDGGSWLIDPACHGGHREYDLAMMRLFGGYGADCFAAYHDEYPLADGWEARVPLHQLAPLIVHAIKFGGGYAAATQRALDALLR